MIFDELTAIGRYKGLSPYLDEAITFIERTNLEELPLGKTVIQGDKVFVNVMEATTQESEKLFFETHKRYIDIQIDLEGTEKIAIGLEALEEVEAYDDSKDFGFYQAQKSITCEMGPGKFMICMAHEPHKPGICYEEPTRIKKCVVKVAAQVINKPDRTR